MKLRFKIISAVSAGASLLLATYLMSAFVAWDFNPGRWPEVGRAFSGVVGGFASVVIAAMIIAE